MDKLYFTSNSSITSGEAMAEMASGEGVDLLSRLQRVKKTLGRHRKYYFHKKSGDFSLGSGFVAAIRKLNDILSPDPHVKGD